MHTHRRLSNTSTAESTVDDRCVSAGMRLDPATDQDHEGGRHGLEGLESQQAAGDCRLQGRTAIGHSVPATLTSVRSIGVRVDRNPTRIPWSATCNAPGDLEGNSSITWYSWKF
jgi:hypothetical protein